MTEKKRCRCDRIAMRVSCMKCGYAPSEADVDLGEDEDYTCDCLVCTKDHDAEYDFENEGTIAFSPKLRDKVLRWKEARNEGN